jgi:hypothetical protein
MPHQNPPKSFISKWIEISHVHSPPFKKLNTKASHFNMCVKNMISKELPK